MLHELYSIRDSKSEVYGQPFAQKTEAEAKRTFVAVSNDKTTFIGKYPEDYDLFALGHYDDNTGQIKPFPSPKHILKAINCVKSDSVKND